MIDNVSDLYNLNWYNTIDCKTTAYQGISFNSLKERYDAIWLTETGQWKTRLSRPLNLYGWDCESLVILNKRVIIPL